MNLISFNTINNTIYIYLIDNNIIIYDDDDTQLKIYKYTLKYKKIIGIILLIILLIIGYYNNFFNIINNSNDSNDSNDSKNDIILQKGGAAVPTKTLYSQFKSGISKRKYKGAAEYDLKLKAAGEAKDKAKEYIAEGAKKTFNKATSASTYYDAGASAARKFKDNVDVIYQILYAIALFIVLCIITIPALSFFIIGIFSYFLLKDKMKTIKRL